MYKHHKTLKKTTLCGHARHIRVFRRACENTEDTYMNTYILQTMQIVKTASTAWRNSLMPNPQWNDCPKYNKYPNLGTKEINGWSPLWHETRVYACVKGTHEVARLPAGYWQAAGSVQGKKKNGTIMRMRALWVQLWWLLPQRSLTGKNNPSFTTMGSLS